MGRSILRLLGFGWITSKLRNALREAEGSAPAVPRRPNEKETFPTNAWYERNYWEPPVQLALRDLCMPGNVVFDVGANAGGLTQVMSRGVGPRGVVCAFEASPRIVDKCQHNLVVNACSNVQLFCNAAYHTSGERLRIYFGGNLNDSLYFGKRDGAPSAEVTTVALDDFVSHTKLVPSLVKMDIEGAELDALKGMEKTIASAKPHMILETQPQDTRCLEFLNARGYTAIDLSSYVQVSGAGDYPEGSAVRNNLYVHRDRLKETPYQPPFEFEEIADLSRQDFSPGKAPGEQFSRALELSAGRYRFDVKLAAEGTDNEMMVGVESGGEAIMRYHAYSRSLASSYRDWVVHMPRPSNVRLFFRFLKGTSDRTFRIEGAKAARIKGFERQPTWLYD